MKTSKTKKTPSHKNRRDTKPAAPAGQVELIPGGTVYFIWDGILMASTKGSEVDRSGKPGRTHPLKQWCCFESAGMTPREEVAALEELIRLIKLGMSPAEWSGTMSEAEARRWKSGETKALSHLEWLVQTIKACTPESLEQLDFEIGPDWPERTFLTSWVGKNAAALSRFDPSNGAHQDEDERGGE